MKRLERLLDLVHVLQSSPRPVPLSHLKEVFADYSGDNDESVRRKFERDKAELARMGVALRYLDDEEGGTGYVVDAEATYLPEIALDEEDRALLATAAQAALATPGFPHRQALRLALAKLGTDPADDERSLLRVGHRAEEAGAEHVEVLTEAVAARKKVHFAYRRPDGEVRQRTVDPYGIFLREGAWYLTGFDHEREARRVFRASRMDGLEVNGRAPETPDFEVPADFSVSAIRTISPLQWSVHRPVEAKVWVDPEVAFLVERDWGSADAEGVFTVETSNLDFLVDQVLLLGTRAELRAPAEGRARMVTALEGVLAVHGGAR
ncbi:MAG: DNA-binding transcriptional regulator [Sandaracinus sp.]|nr:DNA-binding transcriptional regulator [Sandaracinus sp.]|tara:strand:+ start:1348 stop:2313 length:966 start_codon:yes stop_codon:yes gene_type:complete